MSSQWVVSPEAAIAIPGALRLFNGAEAGGVASSSSPEKGKPDPTRADIGIGDETERPQTWRPQAFTAGPGCGCAMAKRITCRPSPIRSRSGEQIVAHGYRIILSLGDQWSDLQRRPKAEVSVKLPNPFYFHSVVGVRRAESGGRDESTRMTLWG